MKIKSLVMAIFVLGLHSDAAIGEGGSEEAPTHSPIGANKYVVKNE